MKIIYIFPSIAEVAGTERILVDKMNYLADKLNNEITLVTYEQGNHFFSFLLSSKIKHIDLNTRFLTLYKTNKIVHLFKQFKLQIQFKKKLQKTITELDPDIIICTSYSSMEICIISKVKTKAIKIIESHISKNHTGNCHKYRKQSILYYLAKIENHFTEKSIRRFDAIVTLTQKDANLWNNKNKVHVIPNMINDITNDISNVINHKVISVGRLCHQKGFDLLIDAWRNIYIKHSNWELFVFGKGDDKKMLLEKIKRYHMDKVIHIEEPETNIYKQYLSSSIYVMSSRYEGFGLVLIEAMSCGLPCVSFDCPFGPSDIIKDGEDGLLVKNLNSNALAQKICYLIEHEDIRKQMGKAARENVKRFLPENIMPRWEFLFETLIEQKKKLPLQKNN